MPRAEGQTKIPTGGAATGLRVDHLSDPDSLSNRIAPRKRKVAKRAELSARERIGLGALGVCVLLALWQILASTHAVNEYISSSPWAVLQAARIVFNNGQLGTASAESGELFGVSLGISIIFGVLIGITIGWYRRVHALVDPLVSLAYAAPRIVLIPLIAVWFGVGFTSQVIITVLMGIFPVIVNVSSGISTINRDVFAMSRSFLATNVDVLKTVALPGAVPSIISGIRQCMSMTLVGVIIAEYLLGNDGIGGLLLNAGQLVQNSVVFVGVFEIAFASLFLTILLRQVERRLDHWRE